jgi:hypothetical protein
MSNQNQLLSKIALLSFVSSAAITYAVDAQTKDQEKPNSSWEHHDSMTVESPKLTHTEIISELRRLLWDGVDLDSNNKPTDNIERRISFDPKNNSLIVIAPEPQRGKILKFLETIQQTQPESLNFNKEITTTTEVDTLGIEKTKTETNKENTEETKTEKKLTPFGLKNKITGFSPIFLPMEGIPSPKGKDKGNWRNGVTVFDSLPKEKYEVIGLIVIPSQEYNHQQAKQAAAFARELNINALLPTTWEEAQRGIPSGKIPNPETIPGTKTAQPYLVWGIRTLN